MATRITKNQLKKQFRKEIAALKEAIHLQCFQCSGCQADGYANCEIPDCPLYPFRLRKSLGRCSKTFQQKARKIKISWRGREVAKQEIGVSSKHFLAMRRPDF